MDVFTYRPGEVTLSVCGYVVEGWTSLSVQRHTPVYRQVRGIRGKNTRVRMTDTSGTFKIAINQTSITNNVFSELVQLDSKTGTTRLEIVLKDNSGSSLFSSVTAYIEGFPDGNFSASQGDRTWTILCDSMDSYFIGGNAEQGVDFASILSKLTA